MDQFQPYKHLAACILSFFISFWLDILEYLYFMKIAPIMTFYFPAISKSSSRQ